MGKYDDIMDLPYHVSKKYPQMSLEARSAQFAPFSALNGYGAIINETARLTDKKIEISDEMKLEIDTKLQIIKNEIKKQPEITIIYFLPDNMKEGGKYVTVIGNVNKIDEYSKLIMLKDGTKIFIDNIIDIFI